MTDTVYYDADENEIGRTSDTTLGDVTTYELVHADIVRVVIGSNVSTLGENCFSGCVNLISIDIPSNVTAIGAGCFMGV